jgi:hypothetical protein
MIEQYMCQSSILCCSTCLAENLFLSIILLQYIRSASIKRIERNFVKSLHRITFSSIHHSWICISSIKHCFLLGP